MEREEKEAGGGGGGGGLRCNQRPRSRWGKEVVAAGDTAEIKMEV
jgi:hypothetical protein